MLRNAANHKLAPPAWHHRKSPAIRLVKCNSGPVEAFSIDINFSGG